MEKLHRVMIFRYKDMAISSTKSSSARALQLKEQLQNFQQQIQEAVIPHKVTLVKTLSSFANQAAKPVLVREAKQVHASTLASGSPEIDVKLGTLLIHQYGKLECFGYAHDIFQIMHLKNDITWNTMITACIQCNDSEMAFHFFEKMLCEGHLPAKVTFVVIVNAYANIKALYHGIQIHSIVVSTEFVSDVVVQTSLLTMYGKCGCTDSARVLFERMIDHNVISWTAMLTVYAENGETKKAFEILSQMQLEQVVPNEITFISLLKGCANEAVLSEGMHLHNLILMFGLESSVVVCNALMYMYYKCCSGGESQKVFSTISEKDTISWNVMISAFARNGRTADALNFFKRMCESGTKLTKATFVSVLDACANGAILLDVYNIQFFIVNMGMDSDPVLGNALMHLYGLCNSLGDAEMLFNKTVKCDIITWNTMLGIYAGHGDGEGTLTLYNQMILEGILPNAVTFIAAFAACGTLKGLVAQGKQLHVCALMVEGIMSEIMVRNSLINMYSKCDSVSEALTAFEGIAEHNIVSYNAILSAHVQHGDGLAVLQFSNKMLLQSMLPDEVTVVCKLTACASKAALVEGKHIHVCALMDRTYLRNVHLCNALIDMYSKCNDVKGAVGAFYNMLHPDIISWNSVIAASMELDLGLIMFENMLQQGTIPDKITYLNLMMTSTRQSIFSLGKQVHARIVVDIEYASDIVMETAILTLYGSFGEVDTAYRCFEEMQDKNLFSWNAIFTAYSQTGRGEKTLNLFRDMQQVMLIPDEITFVSLLSACSHDGLVDYALMIFNMMKYYHSGSFIEDHYSCIIDALGRAGQIESAELLFKAMPCHVSPVPVMTLLGACKVHMDIERGRQIILQNPEANLETYAKLTKWFD